MLFNINRSNIFLDLSPEAKETKAKINKRGLNKFKRFCTEKETVNKMKRQPTEWEKIFANDMTDKGLITKIYKQLIQLNIKTNKQTKKKKTIKNEQKAEKILFQRRQDGHKHMKRCSNC